MPVPDVCFAFEKLLCGNFFINDAKILNCLSDFFEDYLISLIVPSNIRRAPLLPYYLWNFYDATINKNGRTNNSVERWHNGLARFINCHHPDIFKFVEFLKSIKTSMNLK
ncbi:hypothetical protein RF11_12067 [Thelohanellus kitauei]|uniref:MULE domain-containing protein n=1 Tax=Thelohanellus kitauei TaxID=669202 RepID=A0A0C2N4G2_THEKT|nr:hypothetical protein RF11_12067 [Thelohanellus kitauei]